jgi:Na+/melibiose symporter-like transporter
MQPAVSKLSLAQLAVLSLPVFLYSSIELPWRIFLPVFFSEKLQLSLAVVGVLLMTVRIFDMVADPFVGWASDRFPTRWGQRKPWVAASVPLIMLGTWQVFFADAGISLWLLALWCIVMHLGYTMMVTPHGAWGLELANNPNERTRIMGPKIWFAAMGMPLIFTMLSILEKRFHATHTQQVEALGLFLIVASPLIVTLLLRVIPERPFHEATSGSAKNPFRHFLSVLKRRDLTFILGLYALVGLADACSATTYLFFIEDVLHLSGWASTLMLIQALIALVTIPLWTVIGQRMGKRRALIGVFGWYALCAPFALILPAGNLTTTVIFLLLRSLNWSADLMLLRAMVADVSGADAERGERHSGSYYALFSVTQKLMMGLGAMLALWTLGRLGFVPGQHGKETTDVVRLIYALPTLLAGVLGLTILILSTGNKRIVDSGVSPLGPQEVNAMPQ